MQGPGIMTCLAPRKASDQLAEQAHFRMRAVGPHLMTLPESLVLQSVPKKPRIEQKVTVVHSQQ
jgi:hypothetical protein